ncbi:MAG: TRAM domain-containing protein [Treponema sp.]|jgi:23S rRNA (uracil1939-C5)-methyltransferase|nr:TRAM domain-containing protein [Treponema sp.]
MAIGEVLKLHLENIAPGGDALGRIDGKPVFVETGAPDETVLCRVTEERKTWARAELLEIIEKSPVRIGGTCAFYGKCGGCNLQHIDYDTQLSAKTAILKDSILRIGGFQPPDIEVFPSPPWEYRNRMQFHCFRQSAKGEDGMKFGQMGRRSGEITAVSDCPVAESAIRELLKSGGKALPLPPEKDRFTVFSCGGTFLSEGGIQRGKINLLEKEIALDAGVFFQSNIVMLEKLILKLRETAESADRNLPMADLYCGVGTFALFLGEMFPKTFLAEENKTAVSIARENLKGMDAEFFALRDTDWEKTVLRQKASIGFAVADPPRAGLSPKLSAVLAQDGPPVLAYVSCDSSSFARDSKILTNGNYKLKKLFLFDFYPQTAHIESLAVFEK